MLLHLRLRFGLFIRGGRHRDELLGEDGQINLLIKVFIHVGLGRRRDIHIG